MLESGLLQKSMLKRGVAYSSGGGGGVLIREGS